MEPHGANPKSQEPSDQTIDSPPVGAGPVSAYRPPHKELEHIGPFRILERIGEGGMGVIYKAEQRTPVRRVVALKVIKLGMDTKEVLARFDAERQALALMNHPNIARVVDAGVTEAGRPYFAMEFVPGVPLTRYCNEQKLSTAQRLGLFVQVCNAIHHAHQKGIIHRDLKPSNILVTLIDGKPVPKVIDFGIAKATSSALTAHTLYTQTGALIGTPEYMSPEQAQTSGLDVDTRTDIYSLGVILYELLTGTLPFDPKQLRLAGLEGMARIIRETEPQKPSTRLITLAELSPPDPASMAQRDTRVLERELRGDLDWIVLKAMEKDRTRRYESAAALSQDVQRHLENEPVLARPPSARYRIGKFVRRHRAAVVGVAAVAAVLLLGIVGTTAGLLRARDQRDKAVKAEAVALDQKKAAESAREEARNATLFLRDLLMSFGNVAQSKAGVAQAVKRLDEGWLKDQPDTQIACRLALGYYFFQQGAPEQAERQFEAALAASRQRDGSYPPEVAATVYAGRGMMSWMRQDYPTAERQMRLAIDEYGKVPGSGAALMQMYMLLGAVRQRQGDTAEAQKYMREAQRILTSDPALRPYAAAIGAAAGAADAVPAAELLSAGRFAEALPLYQRATKEQPADHWNWYYRACLHLYLGDEAGYREAAKGMLDQFQKTDIAPVGERTAKVCLLTGQPIGEMATIQRLIDQALASEKDIALYRWFALTKALTQYRAGEFESALEFIEKARGIEGGTAHATLDLLAAMANHRLGRAQPARQLLDRAVTRINTELPKPGVDQLRGPENFMICQILRKEAQQLITGKADPLPMPATARAAVAAPVKAAVPETAPAAIRAPAQQPNK